MTILLTPLLFMARWGRLVLIAGLVAGIVSPTLAQFVKGHLPELLVALLFFAALRIGPREALGKLNRVGPLVLLVGLYQVILPCFAVLLFSFFGWAGALAAALTIMLSASPISGSPNLTVMVGGDPAPSLRLLVLSTAMLPLTVIPVFSMSPLFDSSEAIFDAALRLFLIILCSSLAAFVVRWLFLKEPDATALKAIDGMSAFLMAVLVVGLMSAFGPALFNEPLRLLLVLCLAFAVNIALQLGAFGGLRVEKTELIGYSIGAGNRNMALFLAALPAAMTEPLLLYVACYQIPMYLTPYVLGWLYARAVPHDRRVV